MENNEALRGGPVEEYGAFAAPHEGQLSARSGHSQLQQQGPFVVEPLGLDSNLVFSTHNAYFSARNKH